MEWRRSVRGVRAVWGLGAGSRMWRGVHGETHASALTADRRARTFASRACILCHALQSSPANTTQHNTREDADAQPRSPALTLTRSLLPPPLPSSASSQPLLSPRPSLPQPLSSSPPPNSPLRAWPLSLSPPPSPPLPSAPPLPPLLSPTPRSSSPRIPPPCSRTLRAAPRLLGEEPLPLQASPPPPKRRSRPFRAAMSAEGGKQRQLCGGRLGCG